MSAEPLPAADSPRRYSFEEYLELERSTGERHEFRDGEVVCMPGGSLNHYLVSGNLGTLLAAGVKRPCRRFDPDARLLVPATRRTFYADGFVVCGDVQLHEDNERNASITNPRVIFEVLSPNSEAHDRGEKFRHYMRLESLEEYVLISQDVPRVESFLRKGGGDWLMSHWEGVDAAARVRCLELDLPLAALYEGVELAPQEPGEAPAAGDGSAT